MYPLANLWARIWLAANGAKVKVIGREKLDENKQYIFISNHRSYLDTAAMFCFAGKRLGIIAKKELLKVPVLGQGMGFVNVIAIDRSNPERALASMQRAREIVESGYSFGVFAEGTRAMPGQLLPFKKGAFHLAIQTATDIAPIAIKNTDIMMGKKSGKSFPGEIRMVFLDPIEIEGKSVYELLSETRLAIAKELASD